jgi:hypothetical protein
VHHRHAEPRRRGDVDDVEPGAVAPHHLQLPASGHEVLGAHGLAAEEDALRVHGERQHIGLGEVLGEDHAGFALEEGPAIGMDLAAQHHERSRVVRHGPG